MIKRWFNRYNALKHVQLVGEQARFFPQKYVQFCVDKDAQIVVENGALKLGYYLPRVKERPTYNKSVIVLGCQSTLHIHGDVFISPGFYIQIYPGGTLVFRGQNWIAHNCTILCGKYIEFGRNTSLSWNVTMIDDDGRSFYTADGNPIEKKCRPLILEENVGIQMNVVIPKGISIGKNSVVGANAVLRQNVPDNCLVYQNPDLTIRHGTTTGLQNI